jgi:hypothetical protein
LPGPSLLIPAFHGSFASGLSPFWIVLLNGSARGPVLVVEVQGSAAAVLAEVGGAGCPLGGPSDRQLPSGTVDSPVVAATAWSDLGSGWVSGDPALNSLTMAVFGAGTYDGLALPSLWAVAYTPCDPLLGGPSVQTGFVAGFDLTSGNLTGSLTENVDCPS